MVTFRDDGSEQTDVSITDGAQGVLGRGVLEPGAAWKATADTFFVRIKDPASVRRQRPRVPRPPRVQTEGSAVLLSSAAPGMQPATAARRHTYQAHSYGRP